VDSGKTGKIAKFILCKERELTRNIRLRRLQWVGHVMRMKDESVPKKGLKGHIEGRRSVGRSTGR